MTDHMELTVLGDPVAFARAGSRGTRRYTKPAQRDYMLSVRDLAHRVMAGRPHMDGPLKMRVSCTYSYPKSWSAKKRAATVWKTTKPDVDNLAKAVADAMGDSDFLANYDNIKGPVVFEDDAQVAKLITEKRYGERAHVYIRVERLV